MKNQNDKAKKFYKEIYGEEPPIFFTEGKANNVFAFAEAFAEHQNKELVEIGNRLVDHISGGKYITDAEWMKVAELFKTNRNEK